MASVLGVGVNGGGGCVLVYYNDTSFPDESIMPSPRESKKYDKDNISSGTSIRCTSDPTH